MFSLLNVGRLCRVFVCLVWHAQSLGLKEGRVIMLYSCLYPFLLGFIKVVWALMKVF